MGCSSWLYSDTGKQIRNGVYLGSYLLVPEEFELKYGKYIYEGCYDGYGHFSSYDVYELVALWNRKYVSADSIKAPLREQYGDCRGVSGDVYYGRAMERYHFQQGMLEDFKNDVADYVMRKLYGEEYLREVGILIACYDEDNAALMYPLKFVEEPRPYDAAAPSRSDPNQGFSCPVYS